MQARLKARLAVFFYDLESVVGVSAGDLDDHLVCLRINIACAWRRMFALLGRIVRHIVFLR
jgi:hypothetical protein